MMADIAKSGFHASTICLDGNGVMIMGESGTGKTELCLLLLERARVANRVAHFIADDRTLVLAIEDALFASVPDQLAGGVEIRGAGLFHIDYQKNCKLSLAVKLVPEKEAERFPSARYFSYEGAKIPCLYLPSIKYSSDSASNARAIEFTLFGKKWP